MNIPRLHCLNVVAKELLNESDIELVVQAVCDEARQTSSRDTLILHEVIESQKYCQLFVEANQKQLRQLRKVISETFGYEVSLADQ